MALKDYLFHNFWAKLFSVLFATLLWLVLSFGNKEGLGRDGFWMPSSHEKVFANLPVRVLRDSPGPINGRFTIDPTTVTITMKGSARAVDGIHVGDIRPFVDLTRPPQRAGEVTTNDVHVYLPPSVSSLELTVKPPAVSVRRKESDSE